MYDDPDEIVAARKTRPLKPSRENIVDGNLSKVVDRAPVYDFPEEGMYNTAEGMYDDPSLPPSGAPVKGGGASTTVPPSPNFDDGIYMDANDSGAKEMAALKQAGECLRVLKTWGRVD